MYGTRMATDGHGWPGGKAIALNEERERGLGIECAVDDTSHATLMEPESGPCVYTVALYSLRYRSRLPRGRSCIRAHSDARLFNSISTAVTAVNPLLSPPLWPKSHKNQALEAIRGTAAGCRPRRLVVFFRLACPRSINSISPLSPKSSNGGQDQVIGWLGLSLGMIQIQPCPRPCATAPWWSGLLSEAANTTLTHSPSHDHGNHRHF